MCACRGLVALCKYVYGGVSAGGGPRHITGTRLVSRSLSAFRTSHYFHPSQLPSLSRPVLGLPAGVHIHQGVGVTGGVHTHQECREGGGGTNPTDCTTQAELFTVPQKKLCIQRNAQRENMEYTMSFTDEAVQ